MKMLSKCAIAIAMLAAPVAANAYSKPPSYPPSHGGPGGGGGKPTPVPEPEAMLLFGAGIAGVFAARRVRRNRRG
ncbi:PEP-CTERM sorting domain-containing protein [Sphingomonas sp. 37zxx]|uniref:PEP-CTERM sorting domain-containing protein n=1 Tax=Sphingomonas sp. 37zxx TaxID=1550073 RepID=UPI00053BFA88|nr:PEP-CTERM sorting domain-containing protein [Sphingomonas sp. 37zxx]